jgi:two-component sensor histidine kinase
VQAALDALATFGHRADKLLQLSRAESSDALARQSVDLVQLAATVAEEFWSSEPARRRLDLEIAEDGVVAARGDVDSLAIALRNLVENALRYGGEAKVELEVLAPCVLVVRDGGPGCPRRRSRTLRHRHVRHTADAAGYGLGLSIVGTIVDKHGGTLEPRLAAARPRARLRGAADAAAGERAATGSETSPARGPGDLAPARDCLGGGCRRPVRTPRPAAPIEPMLAKVAEALPAEGDWLFEPKWDGFRAIVFRRAGGETTLQSRDLRDFDRYFPELRDALAERLPAGSIVDGEIVIVGAGGPRLRRPAAAPASGGVAVAKLAAATPASFVAFDLLAAGGRSLMAASQAERRQALEALLDGARPPLYLTPATRDRARRRRVAARVRGRRARRRHRQAARRRLPAGQAGDAEDQAPAAPPTASSPGCAGTRAWRKAAPRRSARCCSACSTRRAAAPCRHHRVVHDGAAARAGPGAGAAAPEAQPPAIPGRCGRGRRRGRDGGGRRTAVQRLPGATSRWSAGKDLSWIPLRPERVCEVRYDHLQGDRFRHATTFLRWRPRQAARRLCRYDQLEVVPPYALNRIFGAGARGG